MEPYFFKLRYSLCTILYVPGDNIVIHNFKRFYSIYNYKLLAIFPVLHTNIILAYLIHSSLYPLITRPYLAPLPSLSPLVTTNFFSMSAFLVYSVVCCIFKIPFISDVQCLTFSDSYFTKHQYPPDSSIVLLSTSPFMSVNIQFSSVQSLSRV